MKQPTVGAAEVKGDYLATGSDDLDKALESEIAALGPGCLGGRRLVRKAQRMYELDGQSVLMVLNSDRVLVAQGIDFILLKTWIESLGKGGTVAGRAVVELAAPPLKPAAPPAKPATTAPPTAKAAAAATPLPSQERLDVGAAEREVTSQINGWVSDKAACRGQLQRQLASFLELAFEPQLEKLVKHISRQDEQFARLWGEVRALKKETQQSKSQEQALKDQAASQAASQAAAARAQGQAEGSAEELRRLKAEVERLKREAQKNHEAELEKVRQESREAEQLKAQLQLARAEASVQVERAKKLGEAELKVAKRDTEEAKRLRAELLALRREQRQDREQAEWAKKEAVRRAKEETEWNLKRGLRAVINEADDLAAGPGTASSTPQPTARRQPAARGPGPAKKVQTLSQWWLGRP